MTKGKSGNSGRGHARSAISGRYVTHSTAVRHPKTTVTEKPTKSK